MQLKVNIPELSYSWEEHASIYPRKGQPGIFHRKDELAPGWVSEILLYYDADGSLAGILDYFPDDTPVSEAWMKPFAERGGNFNVIVEPGRQRLGIGMKLLREAASRWPLNFEQQNYTLEGAKLAQHFLSGKLQTTRQKTKKKWAKKTARRRAD